MEVKCNGLIGHRGKYFLSTLTQLNPQWKSQKMLKLVVCD